MSIELISPLRIGSSKIETWLPTCSTSAWNLGGMNLRFRLGLGSGVSLNWASAFLALDCCGSGWLRVLGRVKRPACSLASLFTSQLTWQSARPNKPSTPPTAGSANRKQLKRINFSIAFNTPCRNNPTEGSLPNPLCGDVHLKDGTVQLYPLALQGVQSKLAPQSDTAN